MDLCAGLSEEQEWPNGTAVRRGWKIFGTPAPLPHDTYLKINAA